MNMAWCGTAAQPDKPMLVGFYKDRIVAAGRKAISLMLAHLIVGGIVVVLPRAVL
jgi:hypothetical protein